MRLSSASLFVVLATTSSIIHHQEVLAFAPPQKQFTFTLDGTAANHHRSHPKLARQQQQLFAVGNTNDDDCGCSSDNNNLVVTSGTISDGAKSLNYREAIRNSRIYALNGDKTSIDELIGSPSKDDTTSIVVFLRSLG